MEIQVRIGHGFDVHRLVEGRILVLGGLEIDHPAGLLGHSDADVLTHALIDALLGAAGMGDIGLHFPDTDPAYKGISSLTLLKNVCRLIKDRGYYVVNVDMTIYAEKPRLSQYREAIIENIGFVLGLDRNSVSLKAKTSEGLGFVGRLEGIAASAVALLEEKHT
jgi:2-C-methyl-D-erythritol 2,4-cyclodiphosphate synthase